MKKRNSKNKSLAKLEWTGAASLELPSLKKVVSTDHIKNFRIERQAANKEIQITKKMEKMDQQIQEYIVKAAAKNKKRAPTGSSHTYNGKNSKEGKDPFENDPDFDDGPFPTDIKYLFQENRDGLEPPRMEIPTGNTENLFVTRPIGPYEPYIRPTGTVFSPDPTVAKKPYPSKPSSHTVMRDCNQELNGEMLKRIAAGPKTIDFGVLFVNSDAKRWFHIKNDLKGAITARLELVNEKLAASYVKPQIILSGQAAAFMVNFRSSEIGNFSHIISYIINDKHIFKFMVKAEIIPVNLEINKSSLTLRFSDDCLDMETSEQIRIRNTGNAVGHFKWYANGDSIRVEPATGSVPANTTFNVNVIYRPLNNRAYEEETIDMQVEDGEPRTVKVTAFVNETRCDVSPPTLLFGCLSVAQKSTITMFIKNLNAKNSAIWQIDPSRLLPNLEIVPKKGRVLPDSTEKIELTYCAKIEEDIIGKLFSIKIRGSRSLDIPISVKTIIPKIITYESEYDFGTVTYGNNGTLTMT